MSRLCSPRLTSWFASGIGFGKAISFYVWKVPSGFQYSLSIAFKPVRVCGGSQEVSLSLAGCQKGFSDYLLGAKLERVAILRGYDELSRPVSVRVVF